LLTEVGAKLKPEERVDLEAEFRQIDEVLERLKSGYVYVALFGKTSVGKSAIVNALLGDDVAKVGIEMDLTSKAHEFKHEPWIIVDVPGMRGREELEKLAVEEAKKAHGIIFCLDGEPYGPEMDLFNLVHDATQSVPKIVFVNKWDEWEHRPKADREKVRGLIEAKMSRFVSDPDDIVYGSAQRLDPAQDAYARQELPQLLDRMYAGAGSLGIVMNVIDPARRAEKFGDLMREKIMEVRVRLARKVISGFGAGAVAGSFIPFTDLVVAPGILSSIVYALFTLFSAS
jgi:small GTP-binding protein